MNKHECFKFDEVTKTVDKISLKMSYFTIP